MIADRFAAGRYTVPVLYEDNHLLCVEKPPNLPVQADASGDMDLLTAAKAYIGAKYHKPGAVYLGLVHRLDRPVGGAVVLARTGKAASRLSAQFAAHTVEKVYLAVLQGTLNGETRLVHWLLKNGATGMVSAVPETTPGAKRAELITRPLAVRGGLTLAEVELLTGRAHQIRVQHREIGFPLWGDARYGGGKPGQQLALWAHRLTVQHPTLAKRVTFVSVPPEDGIWRNFEIDRLGRE